MIVEKLWAIKCYRRATKTIFMNTRVCVRLKAFDTYMVVISDLICIFPIFALKLFQHRIFPVFHYRQVKNMHDDCLVRRVLI